MRGVISPFVDIDWLREHRDGVVLADSRWYPDARSGRDAYEAGHIPGAVFIDLDTALSAHADPALGGRHPLPDPEDFAAAMAAAGIGDDDTVVAYDDAGGVIAARLVWMLRVTGHEATLLDGGLAAWDGELEAGAPDAVDLGSAPDAAVDLTSGAATAVDLTSGNRAEGRPHDGDRAKGRPPAGGARSPLAHGPPSASRRSTRRRSSPWPGAPSSTPARPSASPGEPDDLDPRAGHIPGARSVPCRENLDPAGRLLPAAELRDRFAVDDAAGVISYCGSGITACHNLLAMEQVGLGVGRLFPGSWSQWSRDPERPVQTVGE